jgi:hypothetical protein
MVVEDGVGGDLKAEAVGPFCQEARQDLEVGEAVPVCDGSRTVVVLVVAEIGVFGFVGGSYSPYLNVRGSIGVGVAEVEEVTTQLVDESHATADAVVDSPAVAALRSDQRSHPRLAYLQIVARAWA